MPSSNKNKNASRPAYVVRGEESADIPASIQNINVMPEDGLEMGRRMGSSTKKPMELAMTELGTDDTVSEMVDMNGVEGTGNEATRKRAKLLLIIFILVVVIVSGIVVAVLLSSGGKKNESSKAVPSNVGMSFDQCIKDNECDDGDFCAYYSINVPFKSCCGEFTGIGTYAEENGMFLGVTNYCHATVPKGDNCSFDWMCGDEGEATGLVCKIEEGKEFGTCVSETSIPN
mmetsp:Transcript_5648/g.16747  ORF Transcript_5648/g.16747 Transcript_5648/m.16747 type:complete len:230 (-) Transcript_5648:330-1019(-)|eukprot:CAMPEP_0119565610 /NCGR_PEP_ID=MMETSP1352-20130426/30611_1 /TAXON_ID=265584 /ORGANISM="Stauroneis constricta, Strain CCMP1120" /LENGTH=229 /DNA_ID=CAMNT_0007614565 /DNA_START=174 /DNA_END=863 /DNA_ORIENTATION=+